MVECCFSAFSYHTKHLIQPTITSSKTDIFLIIYVDYIIQKEKPNLPLFYSYKSVFAFDVVARVNNNTEEVWLKSLCPYDCGSKV